MNKIVLPLAISFFTFQQIAYLVSAYRGETREYNFLHYCLFVTFFPQLIAGPIVHHKEMLPQFANKAFFHRKHENLAVGLTIFFIGLFKKVILADGMAVYATPVFDAAARGVAVTFFDTWGGVLAYTFQLYFDFSGYSDMAVGLGRMFGIRLPINFHSPYKAVNIIDFWRRWHITLSRFLREYLYFSLGGNRKGPIRRFLNLMITMLLGGLWHGAGWTFVAWGGLHGLYLVINHCWRSICSVRASGVESGHWWGRALSKLLTFTAVVVAWVFFRADSFDAAVGLLQGMAGLNGCILPESYFHRLGPLGPIFASIGCRFEHSELFAGVTQISFIAVLLIIAWYAPNTQQLMANFQPGLPVYKFDAPIRGWQSFRWHPTPSWAALTAVLTLWTLVSLSKTSEFLYFQF